MSPTTVSELKVIIDEMDLRPTEVKDVVRKCPNLAKAFSPEIDRPEYNYIDNMTPELRLAIKDVDAFKRYIEHFNLYGPNTAELDLWMQHEKVKHGLVDFKITLDPNVDRSTLTIESIATDVLALLRAPDLEDDHLE